MKTRKFTKYYVNVLLLTLCIAVLMIVPLLRPDNAKHFGTEPYLNLRLSHDLSSYDELSYGGRYAAYNWGLPWILSFMPPKLLPFILGILSFILFNALLNKFKFENRILANILFLTSPLFITLFSDINNFMIPLTLTLLNIFLILQSNKLRYLSLLSSVIMPLFSLPFTILNLFFLFLLIKFKIKEKKSLYYVIVFLTTFIACLYYGNIIINSGFERLRFQPFDTGFNTKLKDIIADFGSNIGFGLFMLISAIIGISSKWKQKYKNLFIFFSTFILFIAIFFSKSAIIMLGLLIPVFSAQGLNYLWNRRWMQKSLKQLIILTIICGLLFTTLSTINRLSKELPSPEIINGLNKLKALPQGVVFSDYTRGVWINYAGKKNFIDENFMFAPNINERWNDMQTLIKTREWKTAKGIIDKYNFKYIWIDKYMKKKLWETEEDGLLFIIKYNPTIKRIYSNSEVEIWFIKNSKNE